MRIPALLATSALALSALAAGCGGDDDGPDPTTPAPPAATDRSRDGGADDGPARSDGEPRVETVATGLEIPWEIAFLPDGRALVTERPGRVRLLDSRGRLRDEPVAGIDVDPTGEGGLLGLALDPEFEENELVYVYRTRGGRNEFVRYTFSGGRLEDERILVDGIVAAAIHDGGRIRFGPDERLYISTGDAAQPDLSQDPGSLNGKIITLTPEQYRGGGGRPAVFSLGHRNPQGFDWQPGTDRLYSDEHGPDGDDEINLLESGVNYGWPLLRGEAERDGFQAPLAVYPRSIAPSGATFLRSGDSEWTGDYFAAALVGRQIRRLRFDGRRVVVNEPLFEGQFGRLRTVVEGPDGALYALTSNRDGRGDPTDEDDRILRIVPPAG